MKAMILAAGLGTRLKPFTEKHPKALAIVNGKTLLQRNIEYLRSFGFEDIIVNVHHFAQQIVDLLNHNKGFGTTVTISNEEDEVLETGGGLLKARYFFDDAPFVLMNVDVLTDLDLLAMMKQHRQFKGIASLAVTSRVTTRYFLFNDEGLLCGWKNDKTNEQKMSREETMYHEKAFSGIHIISPKLFKMIPFKGKFSMVDVYLHIAKSECVYEFDHSGGKFIDVGKPESISKAQKLFG
jgi:NDP-sugar pyrophosphorylase family protein